MQMVTALDERVTEIDRSGASGANDDDLMPMRISNT